MRKGLIIFIILIVSFSCRNQSKNSQYIVIDLASNINQTTTSSTLNDFFEITQITKLETCEDVLFSHVIFAGVNDNELILNDKNAVFFIDKKSGKLSSKIDRKGNGPGEYIQIMDAKVDNDGNILILDPSKKVLNKYTRQGNFITSIKNDSLGLVHQLKNGSYIVNYTPYVKSAYSIGIYDSTWTLIRQTLARDTITEFRMLYFDALNKYNGDYLFKQSPLGDTIYLINYDKDEPYMVINKGQYKTPANIYADLGVMNSERPKYITNDNGYLIGDLFFLMYNYDNKHYSDIWNIEENKLIYRGIISRKGGVYGIPLVIEGRLIDVWPSYVDGHNLYVEIKSEDAMKFMLGVSEYDNPIIVELKMKESK